MKRVYSSNFFPSDHGFWTNNECPSHFSEDDKIGSVEGCEAYIDNVEIHSTCWKIHIKFVHEVLTRFAEAKPTINLDKREFGHAELLFLGNGHVVGNVQVKPLNAKVQSVIEYPAPTFK